MPPANLRLPGLVQQLALFCTTEQNFDSCWPSQPSRPGRRGASSTVDAFDRVAGKLLGPPRWCLLYVLDIRAADEVRIAAPRTMSRAIWASSPLQKVLHDVKRLHAHLLPRTRGAHPTAAC